jgi:hypothetical protein
MHVERQEHATEGAACVAGSTDIDIHVSNVNTNSLAAVADKKSPSTGAWPGRVPAWMLLGVVVFCLVLMALGYGYTQFSSRGETAVQSS